MLNQHESTKTQEQSRWLRAFPPKICPILAFAPMALASAGHSQSAAPSADSVANLALTVNYGSNDVSVLDTRVHAELARIAVGNLAARVVSAPDGGYIYVLEQGKPIAVRRIDMATLQVDGYLPLSSDPLAAAQDLEISPDGRWLAVAVGLRATIVLIDTSTLEVNSQVELCPPCNGVTGGSSNPSNLHFTSEGNFLWAITKLSLLIPSDVRNDQLTLLRVPTAEIVRRIPTQPSIGGEILLLGSDRLPLVNSVGTRPPLIYDGIWGSRIPIEALGGYFKAQDVAFAEDLGLLAFSESSQDPTPDFLPVYEVKTRHVTMIPAGEFSRFLEYNPFSKELWARDGDKIRVFDLIALQATGDVIKMPTFPSTFAEPSFTPDGRFYYFSGNDRVHVVDTTTKTVVATIPVGSRPSTIVMLGDTSPSTY